MGADFYMNPPDKKQRSERNRKAVLLADECLKWWDNYGRYNRKLESASYNDLQDLVIQYRNSKAVLAAV